MALVAGAMAALGASLPSVAHAQVAGSPVYDTIAFAARGEFLRGDATCGAAACVVGGTADEVLAADACVSADTVHCSIGQTGSYAGTVCGTGWLGGATSLNGGNASFSVVLVGGIGVISGVVTYGAAHPYSGVAELVPDMGVGNRLADGQCFTSFTLAGSLVIR